MAVSLILLSIEKCPCLRTEANLYKHVFYIGIILFLQMIMYKELLICFIPICLAYLGTPSGGSNI